MDPDKTLESIKWAVSDLEACREDQEYRFDLHSELDRLCTDLYHWLKRGGFAPKWGAYPAATGYYLGWTSPFNGADQRLGERL